MTGDFKPTDWTDERLDDAFRARAAERPTPVGLAGGVRFRIEEQPAARRGRVLAMAGLAAAAAVALAVGVSGMVASPGPAGPSAAAGPASFGLPIIDVSGAIDVRDTERSDREIAVGGFYAASFAIPCPAPVDPPNPVDVGCPGMSQWLLERAEPITTTTADGVSEVPPTGPALHPDLALVDTAGLPAGPQGPIPVVMIGHFHDRRADFCPPAVREDCSATFLVDRIDEVGAVSVPSSTMLELDPSTTPHWSAAELDARLAATFPGLEVLSRVALSGARIGTVEPALALGVHRVVVAPIVWAVTALSPAGAIGDPPIRHSLALIDGGDTGYEAMPDALDGFVQFTLAPVAEAPSTPVPSSAPPQPSTTWVGDPITVAEAIEHRDGNLDDMELAVSGFAWRPAAMISCALRPRQSPAQAWCNDNFLWISDPDPGPQTTPTFSRPNQPAIMLLIRPDTFAQIALPPQPGFVTVMGHFDDHRATDCPPADVEACRRNFVVDAILDPDAPGLDRNAIEAIRLDPDAKPVATSAEVVRAATGLPQGADRILVASAVSGGAISTYEPNAASVAELASANTVWLVRYLTRTDDRPVVRTLLVIDGPEGSFFGNVYAVTAGGVVRQ